MRRILGAAGMSVLMMACAGSGESTTSSTRTRIEGTVVQRSLDNARAIAITPDGRRTWAYLDVRGHFVLELAGGQPYRLLIANTLADGSLRAIGHLELHSSKFVGHWIDMRTGNVLDLGALSVKAVSTAPGIGTKDTADKSSSADESTDSSDHEEVDTETHDDDGEHTLCSSHDDDGDDRDDDVALSAEHEPGDEYADEHEKEHDDEDEGDKPCPKAPPVPPPAAPPATTTAPPPAAPPPPSTPPGGPGAPCLVTASCATGLACVASKCVVFLR